MRKEFGTSLTIDIGRERRNKVEETIIFLYKYLNLK